MGRCNDLFNLNYVLWITVMDINLFVTELKKPLQGEEAKGLHQSCKTSSLEFGEEDKNYWHELSFMFLVFVNFIFNSHKDCSQFGFPRRSIVGLIEDAIDLEDAKRFSKELILRKRRMAPKVMLVVQDHRDFLIIFMALGLLCSKFTKGHIQERYI